ncbi:MAG: TonB-dependent receptor plug domain-containing protein [Opitutales bacterium]
MNQISTSKQAGRHAGLPRVRHVLALAILAGAVAAPLHAQSTTDDTKKDQPKKDNVLQLGEFVTTGTRFSDRTVTDSPVPIDVIRGSELTQGGYIETSSMIQAQVPSFNFPRPSLTDGTDSIRPATLRGLSPDQVLVLINGKRRHTSSLVNLNGSIGRGSVSTDFNAIPAEAIGRIEVLRDGASAQYGSDAIAGVINVILRKDKGWGVDLAWGQTKVGDGRDLKFDAYNGTELGDKGSIFTNVWVRDHSPTNRSVADTRQMYFGTVNSTGKPNTISGVFGSGLTPTAGNGTTTPGTPSTTFTLSPSEQTINRIDHRFGDPLSREKGLWVNGDYPLSDSLDLYFFGGDSERRANSAGFFRRPGDDRTIRAIFPNGFLPVIQTKVDDVSFGGGLSGHTPGWTWDVSTVYGTNGLDYRTANSINDTLGTASPTSFYDGRLQFDQLTSNLDLTTERNVFNLTRPLQIAFGAEHRYEQYTIKAGEPGSYDNGGVLILDGPNAGTIGGSTPGAQVFPGFKPGDAGQHHREARALYVDFEQDFTDRATVSIAGRYEDYSDFGSNTTGKISGRVKLTDSLAVRASASTGFRAPHLAQEWFSSTATNFINGIPYDILTFPVSSPGAVALGATPLKPEKSTSESGGFVWTPADNFNVTLDCYNIVIKDRIVLSSNFTGAAIVNLLAAKGITGIGGGRYFTNAVDTTTDGADLSARYVWKTRDTGKLTFTAGANVNTTKADNIKQAPAALAAITTTPLLDLTSQTLLLKSQPKNNLNLAVNWEVGQWSFLLRDVRYGAVSAVAFSSATPAEVAALTPGYDVSLAPAVPGSVGGTTANQQIIQTFGAKWLTDLDISYHYSKHITVSVGANNLFDVYPDQNIRSVVVNGQAFNGSDNAGTFPYSSVSPFGFNGAFYYAKFSLKY